MFDKKAYMAQYSREYRAKNKERIKNNIDKWKEENKEKLDEHNKEYSREYRVKNAELISTKRKEERSNELIGKRIRVRDKSYKESSMKTFLSHKLSNIKKGKHHDKKHDKYNCNIDITYLLQLCKSQDNKCAITGKLMTHKSKSLFSVSIDRIDSNIGYITGNIQLVCKAINLAKNDHSNDDIKYFLNNDNEI